MKIELMQHIHVINIRFSSPRLVSSIFSSIFSEKRIFLESKNEKSDRNTVAPPLKQTQILMTPPLIQRLNLNIKIKIMSFLIWNRITESRGLDWSRDRLEYRTRDEDKTGVLFR